MKVWSLVPVVALATGCMTPRSLALGEMANPIGRGGQEVGTFIGVPFATQADPPTPYVDNAGSYNDQLVGHLVALPGAEANMQFGVNDKFAINLHGSSAGLQPGLKWTVNKSRVFHFAVQPAIALGFVNYNASTMRFDTQGVQKEVNPVGWSSFTFMGGLKALFSHRSGFYGGIGYDFIYNGLGRNGMQNPGTNIEVKTSGSTSTYQNQLSIAAGMDIPLGNGNLHLRPELAFCITPGFSTTIVDKVETASKTLSNGGGWGFVIMPGFSIVLANPSKSVAHEEEEEEGEEEESGAGAAEEEETPKAKGRTRMSEDEEEKPKARSHSSDEEEEHPARSKPKKSSDEEE